MTRIFSRSPTPWIVVLFLLACGEHPETSEAIRVDAGAEPKPTADQEKALANELHKVHLESEEEQIKCRECHRIEGHEKPEITHRCLGCHEDNESAVHAAVKSPEAHECLTCHEFYNANVDAWACATCHTEVVGLPEPSLQLPNAPIVQIHAEETCQSCHAPHGDSPLDPKPCAECHEHEDMTSNHNSKKLSDPDQCLECHGGHEKASRAKQECATCHVRDVPRSARFEGHDTCMTCHTPHDDSAANRCQSCHEDQRTFGAREHPEHRDCQSCHDPHQVMKSPSSQCAGCHEDVKAEHPIHEELGDCAGCHPSHPFRGRLVAAKECVVCHEEAPTETSFHSGEACASCHMPHEFILVQDEQLCRTCHTATTNEPPSIARPTQVGTAKGHETCRDCHLKAHHEPSKERAACRTCHGVQHETVTPGHETCVDCHEPHEGEVSTTCRDCHEAQFTSRHVTDGKDCAQCHRSHGPDGPGAPISCESCHQEKLPLLHGKEGHGECADCHDFHDRGPQRGRSTCLSACHQDQVNHEPTARSCVGCHPFEVEVPVELRPKDGGRR